MPLVSNLFKDNARLQACLTDDRAHLTQGATGEHVHLVQVALMDIDGLTIDDEELGTSRYGRSTASSVLSYKRKRKIINKAYQRTEDDIVGKMTIASLDKEMRARQYTPMATGSKKCERPSDGVALRPVRRFIG